MLQPLLLQPLSLVNGDHDVNIIVARVVGTSPGTDADTVQVVK